MSIDAFDKAFNDWVSGVWYENRIRQEDANMFALVNGLQERGYTVTFDHILRHILVDAGNLRTCIITMRVAREIKPEEMLKWVEAAI